MRAVRGTEARIKAEPWRVHHYTPHQCCYHLLHLKKDEMCSPVVPHNDEKGYGWWSRAARILKTLWCNSPTDSTRKVVPLLLFCIMFLTVRSMSQSSLHQNIIYTSYIFLLPWWTLHHLLAAAAWLLRGRCSCYFCLSMSGTTHIYVRAQRW